MIRTRGRKILRDIISRKFRTLMVSTSIFVGVLGVIALFTVSDLLIKRLEADIQQDKLAMINAMVIVSSDAEPDNAAYLSTLNRQNELGQSLPALEGIEVVEGAAIYPVSFKKPGQDAFEDGFLKSYSVPLQDRRIEPVRLTKGAWPVVGNNEIALEKRMADEYGFEVGESIIFRSLSDAGVREVTYTVAGLVYNPYPAAENSDLLPETSLFAQYEDAQAILNFRGYSNFVARYETFELADHHFEDFQVTLAQHTAYVPVFAMSEDPAQNRAIEGTRSTNAVLSMLAVVAMIVSGFLVVNVINSIVVEQKGQIGVMKSLGGTRWDNFVVYTGMAVLYGIIGTIPAVLLGIPLGFQLTKVMGNEFSILIENFDWSPGSVLIGAIMGVAVPALAAAIPVYNGTRVSILSAMTDLGISTRYGNRRLERWVGVLPLPISVRQAISNLTIRKGRLVLNVITQTLAVGAFMGVLAVTVSLIEEVNAIFDRMNFQIVAIPREVQDQAWIEPLMQDTEGVKAVSPVIYVSAQIEGDYTNFFTNDNQVEALGVDPTSKMLNFNFKSGNGWQDDPHREGVIIASPMARQLGVEAGDEITFRVGGNRVTMPVIGVDRSAFDFMYVEWTLLARLSGFTKPDPQAPGADIPVPNSYAVTIDQPDPTADEVDAVIDHLKENLLNAGVDGTYQNQVAMAETITSFIATFRNIMLIAAILIAMVGAIGLLTTLSINVFERQKEIGVMRSIGAGSFTIVSQFLSEGMFVGLIAWVIGIPISYGLAVALNKALQLETIDFRYRLIIPVMGLAGMVLVALVSSIGPSLAAARKTVSDILRYQ
jgi:putative ABC transport system permease protein